MQKAFLLAVDLNCTVVKEGYAKSIPSGQKFYHLFEI